MIRACGSGVEGACMNPCIEQENWVPTSMKGAVGMHCMACERQQYFWLARQRPSGPAIDTAARRCGESPQNKQSRRVQARGNF